MWLWIYNYIGCYKLKKFLLSTNLKVKYQKFVKITFALTTKDYIALGFDPNMYNGPTCQQMFTVNAKMPPSILNYIKVKNKIICLKKLLFIYPRLISQDIRYFLADSSTLSSLIIRLFYHFQDFISKSENLKAIKENLQVVYI